MNAKTCVIIMYHYVRDLKKSRYPEIKGLELEHFDQQLDFLQNKFTIITMEQLLASVRNNEPLPSGAALLTFDDGYIDHYTNVFPRLYLRGLQGSFFVPASVVTEHHMLDVNKIHYILASADKNHILKEIFVLLEEYRKAGRLSESESELKARLVDERRYDAPEIVFIKSLLQHGLEISVRTDLINHLFKKFVSSDEGALAQELYMSLEQIKLMKQCGMFFGLHGYNHLWLGKTDKPVMENDISKALDCWDGIIDRNCWVMNYPYGNYSPEVVSFIRSVGCKIGLTTKALVANVETDEALTLPRLDTNDLPPKGVYRLDR